VCHGNDESYYALLTGYESIIDRFVCPVRVSQDQLARRLPARVADISTISHGIPSGTGKRASFQGGRIRLVYHGRIEQPQKQVSEIIKIAKCLRMHEVPFEIKIIGFGPALEFMRNAVANHSLSGAIQFLPECEFIQIIPKLLECHVAILTSRWEGFCLSLAEAMALGLPAVAYSCGGVIEEYVVESKTGYIIPWGDAHSFAAAIGRLQADVELWTRLSVAAQRLICDRYSLNRFGDAYAEEFFAIKQTAAPFRRWSRLRRVFV
jgi:glycosyltransferase involved in cell wall biosynthesis